jgi:hypothetical protein
MIGVTKTPPAPRIKFNVADLSSLGAMDGQRARNHKEENHHATA